MANPEELGPSELRINRLNKFTQTMNKQTERMTEIQVFWEMTEDQIPQFVADRVPTPNKDEPFAYEHQDSETNSLLVEIREWPASARTGYIIGGVSEWVKAAIYVLIGYLISRWLQNDTIFGVVVGITVTLLLINLISVIFQDRKRKMMYDMNLRRVETFILESDAKFWNDERLKKWAVARYKLTSAESFKMILGIEGMMMEEGPMKGRFVSTSDGKEWTLRPVLEETV